MLFKTMPATGIVDMSTTSQERQRPIEIHSKMDTCASDSSTACRIVLHPLHVHAGGCKPIFMMN